jgi:GNAT superfamily N-acetyltransferase
MGNICSYSESIKYRGYKLNWYKMAMTDQTAVKALEKNLTDRYPGLDLDLWISNSVYVELAVIEVPKEMQGQGIGHKVVEEVKQFAQSVGLPVVLRPSSNPGKKQALERFYKDLGFIYNKGKNRDFRLSSPISTTMYWRPEEEQI